MQAHAYTSTPKQQTLHARARTHTNIVCARKQQLYERKQQP
jgi:hypothetical protein